MVIIHITYAFGLGGIETMLRNIANEQARFGYNIHLIVINNNVNDELRTSLNEKSNSTAWKGEKVLKILCIILS